MGIHISNPEKLEEIKKNITQDGCDNFHVLADFDDTLTKTYFEGKKVPSSFGLVRHGNHLDPQYKAKAQALFEIYHPIEIDVNLSREEKARRMEEWWRAHLQLLTEYGFGKQVISEISALKNIFFRDGALEFIDVLHEKNIPLIIMSAGLGDVYREKLAADGRLYPNMHLISNFFDFNEAGKAISVPEPIIHSMNKHETAIHDFPSFKAVKDRKNVLLLGNLIEDIGMIEGFEYSNLIKIGFLNERIEENLKKFQENFDVVISGDGGMEFVNSLVEELFG